MHKELVIDGAIVDWLEEIPTEEFVSSTAETIVSDFRNGFISVTEAIDLLRENCSDELAKYVQQNVELNELLNEDQ